MRTVEIPRNTWPTALNDFSNRHLGWPISIDVLNSEIGAQPEVQDLPLMGVAVEEREGGTIVISAAKQREHLTHIIHAPNRVWIEQDDEGTDVALQVEASESTTIIRVGAPPADAR